MATGAAGDGRGGRAGTSGAGTSRPGTLLREVGRTALGAVSVVLEGLRLLAAHWPVLLVVLLIGATGRELALWASLVLSREHPVLATLVVPLAPLASVVALVVALRVVLPSLRHLGDAGMGGARQLSVVTGALVPFLAVYAGEGLLRQDIRRFLNEAYADEALRTNIFLGEQWDDRTWAGAPWWQTVAIVVLTLVLRRGLDRGGLAARSPALGFLAGWVEALWLMTIATTVTGSWRDAWTWVTGRQGVAWLLDAWAWVVRALGPVGGAVDAAVGWLFGVLGDFDTLVVVPLAWLTVGAVVYGRELGDPAPAPELSTVRDRVIGSIDDDRTRARLQRAQAAARGARDRASRACRDGCASGCWARPGAGAGARPGAEAGARAGYSSLSTWPSASASPSSSTVPVTRSATAITSSGACPIA